MLAMLQLCWICLLSKTLLTYIDLCELVSCTQSRTINKVKTRKKCNVVSLKEGRDSPVLLVQGWLPACIESTSQEVAV